ncbi:MAG: hypothetical protein JW778_05820 [Candidatus Altiarchaeota archaeon]|nr:hypothetical protein [Candidatus Altiarchaeota archaeon]
MKKKIDEVVDFFVKEVKDLPKIEGEVNVLLDVLDKPLNLSGDWRRDYQSISDLEINAKKALEVLTPLAEVPVGLGDSFISLRTACEKVKGDLMEKKMADEEQIKTIELNRRNLVFRLRNFIKDIEPRERKALKRILAMLEENKKLKKRVQRLEAENKKLKKSM